MCEAPLVVVERGLLADLRRAHPPPIRIAVAQHPKLDLGERALTTRHLALDSPVDVSRAGSPTCVTSRVAFRNCGVAIIDQAHHRHQARRRRHARSSSLPRRDSVTE